MAQQKPSACVGCPLHGHSRFWVPPPSVTKHTRLVVFGESAGATEEEQARGFCGQSGKLLREWLGRAGLAVWSGWGPPKKDEEVCFRNVICCKPNKNVWPGEEVANECLRRHQHTQDIGDTPVVAYGANASAALSSYSLPILKTRGGFLPMREGLTPKLKWFVSSLHPAFLVRGGGADNPSEAEGKAQGHLKPMLGLDARRAMDCPEGPQIPEVKSHTHAYTLPSMPPNSVVSIDMEGTGKKPNIVGVCWDTRVAHVVDWGPTLRTYLSDLFKLGITPTFHNAAYDVPELDEAGVKAPKVWYDTINMAAVYDPEQPMNLQTQVLMHVDGSVAWKGLIDHELGPDYDGGKVGVYRKLWTDVLHRLGRTAPDTGKGWYDFYNMLDTAWGLALALRFEEKLTKQGRWNYYIEIMCPLQRPLLEIGARGMPCDEAMIEVHRKDCLAKVEAATKTLREYGNEMLGEQQARIACAIIDLEAQREAERKTSNVRAFSKAAELTKLRTKAKGGQFNPDSHPQRSDLLYTWYGLPPIKNAGGKGYTTDDTAVKDLLSRLERGTIKPKRGDKAEVKAVLEAMMDAKRFAVLERTFLRPELRDE